MSETLVKYDSASDQLSLNQAELSSLPKYNEVINKLEQVEPGYSKQLLKEINGQLSQVMKNISAQTSKMDSLLAMATGKKQPKEKMDKIQAAIENASQEIKTLFANFDAANHYAGTDLIQNISRISSNPNLTKLAQKTAQLEDKKPPIQLAVNSSYVNKHFEDLKNAGN